MAPWVANFQGEGRLFFKKKMLFPLRRNSSLGTGKESFRDSRDKRDHPSACQKELHFGSLEEKFHSSHFKDVLTDTLQSFQGTTVSASKSLVKKEKSHTAWTEKKYGLH